MNKQNNQRAAFGDSTMMEHLLYHVQSVFVGFWVFWVPFE